MSGPLTGGMGHLILDHLTRYTHRDCTVDEMTHTGKAGTSFVERWALSSDEGSPWIWRVVYLPHVPGRRNAYLYRETGERAAYGTADSQEDAQRQGRSAGRMLAKERRALSLRVKS